MTRNILTYLGERFFGPPMAAPETLFLRSLRYWLIAQLIMVGLLALFAKEVREATGVGVGGIILLGLASIIPAGILWWRGKKAADDEAWDERFCGDENGK